MLNRRSKETFMILGCAGLLMLQVDMRADGVRHLPQAHTSKGQLITSAYPNPFNDHTTIFYSATQNEFVKIKLYSSKGTLLGELFDDMVEKGSTYQFELDGRSLSPGVYFYTIESKSTMLHQRLELIR